MDLAPDTPPPRRKGGELSLSGRYALAFEIAGMGHGWLVELVTQPAQSPHLKINDLGFFASLKSKVWGMNASTVDELVQTIFDQYEEYDGDTLERVWQSLFKVYNQTLSKLGDNDFSCLLYTSPSPRDLSTSRMPSSA